MAIYQLIACTIIANDILKASVYFGTEVFRTEILRCVTPVSYTHLTLPTILLV